MKLSKNTFKFKKPPAITGYSSIVGGKEGDGPIGDCFDAIEEDSYFGQDSWEKAESEMQKRAVKMAIAHSGLVVDDIDFIFSGDLINQCTSSSYGLRDLNIPFLGLYGACSTMAEGLLISSIMVSGGFAKHTVNATSSHFSTAEKQFRFPLSYGGQRTPYAQWTCTASGATVLSAENTAPYVRGGTIGKIVDYGITDANNMGAAMAPAAADTIKCFLMDTKKKPSDFDVILTGDLGEVGSQLLIELLQKENINISCNHKDCGIMIFDKETQDTHAGGSGCGCSASVLCGYFMKRIKSESIKNLLFVGTGALMSPTLVNQSESIPAIAHSVWISSDTEG